MYACGPKTPPSLPGIVSVLQARQEEITGLEVLLGRAITSSDPPLIPHRLLLRSHRLELCQSVCDLLPSSHRAV